MSWGRDGWTNIPTPLSHLAGRTRLLKKRSFIKVCLLYLITMSETLKKILNWFKPDAEGPELGMMRLFDQIHVHFHLNFFRGDEERGKNGKTSD